MKSFIAPRIAGIIMLIVCDLSIFFMENGKLSNFVLFGAIIVNLLYALVILFSGDRKYVEIFTRQLAVLILFLMAIHIIGEKSVLMDVVVTASYFAFLIQSYRLRKGNGWRQ